MIKSVETTALFDCQNQLVQNLFFSCQFPWEILSKLKDFFARLTENPPLGFTQLEDNVFLGNNVKIDKNALLKGPAVICDGCEIRTGAFIRGNVFIGENCVIGNSTELKNCILLNNVQVPHYNYVGDSILGNYSHLGAGAICSNLKSDGKNVVIHGEKDYPTNLRKVGAFLGDHSEIGCGCVLNPGTVIGKNSTVYPLTSVRGVTPANYIVKSNNNIIPKR